MKTKTKAVIGAAAMAAAIAGLAYATPIVNLASPLFSVGQRSYLSDSPDFTAIQ